MVALLQGMSICLQPIAVLAEADWCLPVRLGYRWSFVCRCQCNPTLLCSCCSAPVQPASHTWQRNRCKKQTLLHPTTCRCPDPSAVHPLLQPEQRPVR